MAPKMKKRPAQGQSSDDVAVQDAPDSVNGNGPAPRKHVTDTPFSIDMVQKLSAHPYHNSPQQNTICKSKLTQSIIMLSLHVSNRYPSGMIRSIKMPRSPASLASLRSVPWIRKTSIYASTGFNRRSKARVADNPIMARTN
ncbi:MAG: hypothetical protein Q9224_003663 [Gallowayella concinna]